MRLFTLCAFTVSVIKTFCVYLCAWPERAPFTQVRCFVNRRSKGAITRRYLDLDLLTFKAHQHSAARASTRGINILCQFARPQINIFLSFCNWWTMLPNCEMSTKLTSLRITPLLVTVEELWAGQVKAHVAQTSWRPTDGVANYYQGRPEIRHSDKRTGRKFPVRP